MIKRSESSDSPLLKLLIKQINETVRLEDYGGRTIGRPFANRASDLGENSVEIKTASQSDWSPRF